MLIDLTTKALPTTVQVGGRAFSIQTDYSYWIAFGKLAKDGCITYDVLKMFFIDEVPPISMIDSIVDAFIEFYTAASSTPRASAEQVNENVTDYYEDGEYIYASFMSCYGIDLLETDMHWHKFKALVNCLRESKYNDVISYRSWKKNSQSYDDVMAKLKDVWSLEQILTDEEQKKIDEFNSLFD